LGFDGLFAEQTAYLTEFWRNATVEIGGDESLQQGMRFSEFHLLQSAGRNGKTNIAAKGVTGAGYDGHYFWDTEIYVLPFFLHTRPEIARKLLESRASMLSAARTRALEMAHKKGALYPWRTITGPECSSYFPAGTAQYHINADIAYSIAQYTDVTGDRSFLLDHGAEVVFETARIWPDLGQFDANGRFGIYTVTGPDEYTAIVNNNLFTNVMARHHLRFAAKTAAWLQSEHPAVYAELATKIGLTTDEIATWQRAADHMILPYDETRGIHAQDDTFLDKPVWDFANTPRDKYPLLLHYHPLVIYRHQVCKQPDVVLALLLLGHEFTAEDKKRNYDYYETITTHDSSLSSCIFSIMAADVGYTEKAYDYFMQTARLDIDNLHHNTEHGVHAAALAGSWMSVVYGFAGLRSFGGVIQFAPFLPKEWTHYQFVVRTGQALLQVRVESEQVHYSLLDGTRLEVRHRGQSLTIVAGQVSSIAI
jgi:alpha,alpha-trehalose phosphorylase